VQWLWLKKTEPDKPWASFQLHSGHILQQLFDMVVAIEIGDGTTSLLWLDRWVHGQRIEDLDPRLFHLMPKRVDNKRSVADVLTDSKWVHDLRGHLTESMLHEFLLLSELVANISTQPGRLDKYYWCLSVSG
jgi:hypothetical protein